MPGGQAESVTFGPGEPLGELRWADDELRGPRFEAVGTVAVAPGRRLVLNLRPTASGRLHEVKFFGDVTLDTLRATSVTLTAEDVRALVTWPLKRKLIIHNTVLGIEQTSEVAKLESLERLTMKGCRVRCEALTPLQKLKSLNSLFLTSNPVDDIKALGGLTEIGTLGLGSTRVNDAIAPVVAGMRDLKKLWLTSTEVSSELLPSLSALDQLEVLPLGRTRVSDRHLEVLAGLPALSTVDLTDTAVTNQGIRRLASHGWLKELYLDGTHVDDGIIDALEPLPLRMLSVERTSISASGLQRLRASLPKAVINGLRMETAGRDG